MKASKNFPILENKSVGQPSEAQMMKELNKKFVVSNHFLKRMKERSINLHAIYKAVTKGKQSWLVYTRKLVTMYTSSKYTIVVVENGSEEPLFVTCYKNDDSKPLKTNTFLLTED